jgi:hypothetical protein
MWDDHIVASHLIAPIILETPSDDPDFIQLVRQAVSTELEAKATHGLFLIRIDNWFDSKWRMFAGIGRVEFDDGGVLGRDTALDSFYRGGSKSTFPPFTPNRIISEEFYGKDENGVYVLDENGPWVHFTYRRRSSANLQQRITAHNNSSLFVWFSSNTLTNRRGSLMIYRANGRVITSWYASFFLDGHWRAVRTHGISRQVLLRFLER